MSRLGIRARTAILAAGLFAVVLTAMSFLLLVLLQALLIEEIDTALESRANDIAFQREDAIGLAAELGFDDEFDLIGGLGFSVELTTFAAWLNPDGTTVLADDSSIYDDASIGPRLVELFAAGDGAQTVALPELTETEGSERMRAVAAFSFGDGVADPTLTAEILRDPEPFDDGLVLILGTSLRGMDSTLRRVAIGAGLAIPFLTLLVGGLVWLVAGRALRPVEAIRAEVDDISASDLSRRVPEPRATDQIGSLAVTMNQMLERLETSQDTQRRFVADASHELRSPLASIAAQLDVELAHRDDDTPWFETVRSLRSETERLQRLVEDLLLLARADASAAPGAAAPQARLVDVDDLVLAEVDAVGDPRVSTTGVSSGVVRGDPDKLRRLVMNLLANAVRHADRDIRVSVIEHLGRVELVVADDGAGVPATDRDRIFERFVRLDEARARDVGGSGLGLAICLEIAIEHGGSLTVRDSDLGGAAFVASFPAT